MGKTNRNSIEYCFNHTKIRMLQRHKLDISQEEYNDLCSRYPEQVTILKSKEGQHIFETEFKGKKVKLVWCANRKAITTVF